MASETSASVMDREVLMYDVPTDRWAVMYRGVITKGHGPLPDFMFDIAYLMARDEELLRVESENAR